MPRASRPLRREIAEGWDLEAIRSAVIESQRRRRYLNRSSASRVWPGITSQWWMPGALYIRNTVPIFELEQRSRFPAVKGSE